MFSIKISTIILIISMLFPKIIFAADTFDKAAMQKLILETIRENPQVLLDILRNNSEAVLDIAQQGSNTRRLNALTKQWKKDLTVKKKIHIADRPIFGNKNAKVNIIAFSDFLCHYCHSSKAVVDSILKEFKDNVNFVFKSIPLDEKGPSALAGAWFLAIAKQDEQKAWIFYNTMFEQRDKLSSEGESFIHKTAKDLNLNVSKIEKDVKNDKKIKSLLKEDHDDAEALNVEGTPCFYINNIVIKGALSLDFFRVAVKMALENAAK